MAEQNGTAVAVAPADPAALTPGSNRGPLLGIGINPELLSALIKKKKQIEEDVLNPVSDVQDKDEGYGGEQEKATELGVPGVSVPQQIPTAVAPVPPPMPAEELTDDGMGKDVLSVGASAAEVEAMDTSKPIKWDIVNTLANLKAVAAEQKETAGGNASAKPEPMSMMAQLGEKLKTAPTAMNSSINIDEKLKAMKQAKTKTNDSNTEPGQVAPAPWLAMSKIKRRASTPAGVTSSETELTASTAVPEGNSKGVVDAQLQARLERRRTLNGETNLGEKAAAEVRPPPPPKVLPKPKPKPLPEAKPMAKPTPVADRLPILEPTSNEEESANSDQDLIIPCSLLDDLDLPPPPDFLLYDDEDNCDELSTATTDQALGSEGVPPQVLASLIPTGLFPVSVENVNLCHLQSDKQLVPDVPVEKLAMESDAELATSNKDNFSSKHGEPVTLESKDVQMGPTQSTTASAPPPPPPLPPPPPTVHAQRPMEEENAPGPILPKTKVNISGNVGSSSSLRSDLLASIRSVNKNTFLKKKSSSSCGGSAMEAKSQTAAPAAQARNCTPEDALTRALAARFAAFKQDSSDEESDVEEDDGEFD